MSVIIIALIFRLYDAIFIEAVVITKRYVDTHYQNGFSMILSTLLNLKQSSHIVITFELMSQYSLLIFLSQAFFPSLPFIFLRFSSPVASTHPLMTDFSFWISQIQLYMPKVHAQFMTFLIRFLISFLIVTCYLLTFLLIIFFTVQAFLFDVLQSF